MTNAAKKSEIRFPTPTTIDAALAVFEQMRTAVETAEAQVEIIRKESEANKAAAENLRGAVEGLNNTIAQLRDCEHRVADHAIELAEAVACIKAGRLGDAAYTLERVLQIVDPRAKARCAVVVLPAAGSFAA